MTTAPVPRTSGQLRALRAELTEVQLREALRIGMMGTWDLELRTGALTCSDRMCELFGFAPDDVLGSFDDVLELVLPADRATFLRARSESGAAPTEAEYRIQLPGGGVRHLYERAEGLTDADGNVDRRIGIIVDVTAQRRADALRTWEARVLESVALGRPLPQVLELITVGVEEQVPGAIASVLLADRAEGRMRHGAAPSLPDEYNRQADGTPIGPDQGSCGTAAYLGEVVIVSDIATDPRWAQYKDVAAHFRLGSSWSTPVFDGERQVVATFAIYHRTPRAPQPEELALLDRTAHLVSVAVQGARLEADLLLRNRELKRANEQLAENQALLRIAGRAARLGAWAVTVPDYRTTWSDETAAIHEEPPGFTPPLDRALDYIVPEERAYVTTVVQVCAQHGTPFDIETQIVTAKGRRVWVRAIGEAVRDDAGRITRIQGALQDISGLKEAQEYSRKAGELLDRTLETMSDGFFTLGRDWRFTYVNREAEQLMRRGRNDLLGRSIWEEFPQAVGTESDVEYHRAMDEGVTVAFEQYFPPLEKWFEVKAFPGSDGIAVYFRDITERRRAEEALRFSEERFRVLTRVTNDAVWEWDLVADTVRWSDGYEALFGYPCDGATDLASAWVDHIHPDDRDRVVEGIRQAIDGTGTEWQDEYRYLHQDGHAVFVLDRGHIIRDENGRAITMVGGITDLTELRESEERLRELATLLDKAHDAIIVRDMHHRIQFWSVGAERMYGWPAAAAIGRSIAELLYRDRDAFLAACTATIEHGEWNGELQQVRRDGDAITVEARWTLVRDTDGNPRSILAINTDVTQRKKLEAQYLRAQRMESIGTLAGGIAHDLNNVLAPIILSIDLLRTSVADQEGQEILDTIGESAQRGAAMVAQVLSFARGLDGRKVRVDPAQAIRDLVRLVSDSFPKDIAIDVQVPEGVWALDADPTQLHQVLLNLAVNARDAMPHGGTLTIRAENMDVDQQYAAMNMDATPGPYVRLDVEDEGTGMPPEIVERIFDPFFTTKEVGKGTGLGLSTSLAIVKSHGGFLRVYSEPGAGTKFRIYLPARTDAQEAADLNRVAALPRGNGETVLIVDDEASIRQITGQTLEAFGYRVLVAADGADAVSVYMQHRGTVAVVLLDMMMPVMDGTATARVLRQLDPSVRIIGASGMAAKPKVAEAAAAGITHFLAKPFTAEALLSALRRELEPGSAESARA